MLFQTAVLFTSILHSPVVLAKNEPMFEIQFEPMEDTDDIFESFPPSVERGRSNHPQEDDLDQILGAMLGGPVGSMPGQRRSGLRGAVDVVEQQNDILRAMLGGPGGSMPGQKRGGPRGNFRGIPGGLGGSGPFGGGPIMIQGGGAGSPQISIEMSGPIMRSGPSGLPAGLLRDLFPGPLATGDQFLDHPQPFDRPDPAVLNMLNGLDMMFASTLLPMVHKLASVDRAPNTCLGDLQAHCADPSVKSQLHCLGEHQTDISDACHKEVGKSVPFRCSKYIDKFCDVLEDGLLPCLQKHTPELDDRCRDAVLATQNVIVKSKTEKATMVDPATGTPKVSAPVPSTGGGAASTPSVAAMLSLANAGYDFAKDVETWPYLVWTVVAVVSMAASVLGVYALTFTPYCPRQLRSLLAQDRVEKDALLKCVDMPKPTLRGFAA